MGVGRGGVALVVALGALSAFGPLCLDMYLPALTELAPTLQSTNTAAQLSLSACIVGLALGQLVAGSVLLAVAVFAELSLWPVLVAFFVMVSSVGLALTHAAALAMDRRRDVAVAVGCAAFLLASRADPAAGAAARSAASAR